MNILKLSFRGFSLGLKRFQPFHSKLGASSIPKNNFEQESPYKYLQVKSKLNLIQHREMMMNVSQENIQLLNEEETQNHYLVRSFFPHFASEIKCFECKNKLMTDDFSKNYPRNSWNKIILPLSSNEKMRNKFSRFYSDTVRIGVLMEILDYQAVISGFNHLYNKREDVTLVTGSVDNINFYKRLQSTKDLIIISYPSFVGSSSIEIAIDIYQKNENDQEELRVSAGFVMVARQKADHKKSYQVPRLCFEGEENEEASHMRQAIGEKKSTKRKQITKESLAIKPPTSEEIQYVHRYYLHKDLVEQNDDWIQIGGTLLSKTLLMHMQDRNLHGKIFGGYLMREAFEIGWLSAYKHTQGIFPEIYHIDDFQFFAPVTVGDIMEFKSQVSYVKGDLIHVYVEVTKITLDGKSLKTNDLNLTFLIPPELQKNLEKPIQRVYPVSYKEAMLQCDSRRRISELL